jgi:hypothetical protein
LDRSPFYSGWWQFGAPRPMKMGTIALPWRYDVAAASAIRSDNQRRTAIFRYASWAAVFPVSPVVILRLRPFSINPGTARWALDALFDHLVGGNQ